MSRFCFGESDAGDSKLTATLEGDYSQAKRLWECDSFCFLMGKNSIQQSHTLVFFLFSFTMWRQRSCRLEKLWEEYVANLSAGQHLPWGDAPNAFWNPSYSMLHAVFYEWDGKIWLAKEPGVGGENGSLGWSFPYLKNRERVPGWQKKPQSYLLFEQIDWLPIRSSVDCHSGAAFEPLVPLRFPEFEIWRRWTPNQTERGPMIALRIASYYPSLCFDSTVIHLRSDL